MSTLHRPVGSLCALIVMGVSGSGKSTIAEALAQKLGWMFRDADTFHPPANVAKMSAGQPLTDDDRWPWLQAIADAIDASCARHERLVVTCSALKRSYRDVLVHRRDDVQIVFLDGSRELIAKRLAKRTDHFMPASLLDSQFAALERPASDEPSIAVPIDCDVDAIVADIVTRLDLTQTRDQA